MQAITTDLMSCFQYLKDNFVAIFACIEVLRESSVRIHSALIGLLHNSNQHVLMFNVSKGRMLNTQAGFNSTALFCSDPEFNNDLSSAKISSFNSK